MIKLVNKTERKKWSSLRHNILMYLLQTERAGCDGILSEKDVDDIRAEAVRTSERLWPEYSTRQDAPLWLNRLIREAKSWTPPTLDSNEPWVEPKLHAYFDKQIGGN